MTARSEPAPAPGAISGHAGGRHLLSVADLGRGRHRGDPAADRQLRRGQLPGHPQGAGPAGQDGGVAVLRGLDPHPAQLRDRGPAPVGRRHDLLGRQSRRSTRASPSATPSRPSRPWASTPSWSATPASGVPWQVARWLHGPSVINAGDGWHEHPTQALLDCYTIRRERQAAGRARSRAGPARRSTGCRSPSSATSATAGWPAPTSWRSPALGAQVTLVAPPTLLPPSLAGWPVEVSHDLDVGPAQARRGLPAAAAAGADARGPAAVAARVHRHLRADPGTGPPAPGGRLDHAPGSGQPGRGGGRRGRRPCRRR